MDTLLQKKLLYRFKDLSNLRLALTHKSCGSPNNEELEFLGDRVLGLSVALLLYKNCRNLGVGGMTELASKIVSHEGLLEVARNIELDKHLRIAEVPGQKNVWDSALSDAVEAIIAVIFLESGSLGAATSFVIRNIGNLDSRMFLRNPKTELQERLQAYGYRYPTYQSERGIDGTVRARVKSEGLSIKADGQGRTKKVAEFDAARNMLRLMRQKGM